ncbi:MAG: ATP-binding protein [Flavobacterium sp.]|jgi:ATP-dependent DNA helicase RecG|uniref:ATP-binding protein n=2 Tax=Flavobacterium sp. TaxID=239 RepID=UPI0022C56FB0|nr:RNA-binding domain-containing protein [Flavobacterium sp.]MCZ8168006.1 putative DNA binding domain-containing protein [Flavobacterium sp.]MCZ8295869.1 putative DNA binding domain-containing protein [Flavobacterium sp.]
MTEKELQNYLINNFPIENEKCEWKEFKSLKNSVAGKEGDDIVSYISAIANMQGGHLVIGVKDGTLEIVGIQDFAGYSIHDIRYRINGNCTNLDIENFSVEEFKTSDTNKTIWLFKIPKHLFRLPVYAHKKTWQRIDDNLVAMTKSRLDAILTEIKINEDWSKEIIDEASIDDLDTEAIKKAKIEFIKRNPKYSDEIGKWSDVDFLNKAKITIKGKITRTALILLGKEEAEHYLNSTVKIRWNLKSLDNQDKDFEIFSIPFLLNIDEVYKKIRNLKYRYLREGTLFPDEVLRYEPFIIRESLNNAIAHQDYTKGARINVVEFEDDHLVFSNYGSFLPKSVEEVVLNDTPEEVYRNPFLVEAMKNLDMIETQGGGIKKMFNFQRQRFFPLPDFDFDDNKVKVTITGKILDENFARILIKNSELRLEEIILLDKVQKKKEITESEFKHLKKCKYIEGRKPNIYLSHDIVVSVNNEELKREYLENRSFDDPHFKEMILEYLRKWGKCKRDKIDNLIIPKLSTALSEEKKKNKVTNYLSALRMEGKIKNTPGYFWEIV